MHSFPYLEPVCCSMSSSDCCFLTCIQISQEAGQVVWYAHLFQNFPQFIVIHTVKGFGIVNKAVDFFFFFEVSCFFSEPADIDNLISGSSAFSKTSLNIWKFTVHVLLKPGLENFEHYFTRVWDECSCVAVWAFLGIAFFWDWNKNWPFPFLWPLLSFPNLLALMLAKSRTWLSNWTELNWTELNARKDWRQEEKRTTEDEMVGWHHWLNGHDFE